MAAREVQMMGFAMQPIVQGTVVGAAPSKASSDASVPFTSATNAVAPSADGPPPAAPYHYPTGARPGTLQYKMDRMDEQFNQRVDEIDAQIKKQMDKCCVQ
eukprot:CAMPEP_0171181392 /NCGR_PEP_ID=MMETSP0790-20130122/14237_1 /TAXON_ID=2925 /ORGANISM="Alexandrium catenella, Strain OF101" /LENGTH=100 /DNA_ID=CAMNT_0011646331 /DNA_START=107 /DNA_END=409 /DNA_ORIENTATION=-